MTLSRRKSKTSARTLNLEQLEHRHLLAADIFITEFSASNSSLEDSFGETPDWVEVYNNGDMAADLSNYYLTDNAMELDKWAFPSRMIEPGEFVVVYASGRDVVVGDEIHTNFNLSKEGEYLGLIESDAVTVKQDFGEMFPEQDNENTYGLSMESDGNFTTILNGGATASYLIPNNGNLGSTWTELDFNDGAWASGPLGLGYENSPADYQNLINTTVPSGTTSTYVRIPFTLSAEDAVGSLTLGVRFDDGFVAYINGVKVADANAQDNPGWNAQATSNHSDNQAVNFVDFDASDGIGALNVGENVLAIHMLNVSSSSSDYLLDAELSIQTSTLVTPIDAGYLASATPGFTNGESFNGFTADVEFSVPHGFYDSPVPLELTTSTEGAKIVYTTDGSAPAVNASLAVTNGTEYVPGNPIIITSTQNVRAAAFKAEFSPSFPRAQSYLFTSDIVNQSPNGQSPGPGWPSNNVNGQDIDYGIDPDIINIYGEQAVIDSLESLSAISITTDVDNLFSSSNGIYVNAGSRGRNWERDSSVELIYPDGSNPGFSANAGLRIRGGFSRTGNNPKHAFRFYFRDEYGDKKLRAEVFGNEGANEYDVLDLRTSQNYSWAFQNSAENTFVREVWGRDLQRDMGQPYTRSIYHHLFINGVYWGLFQTQERILDHYGEQYLGGNEEEYDVIKSAGNAGGYTQELADGNLDAWRDLWEMGEQVWQNPVANADLYYTMQGLNPDGTRDPNLPVLLDVENLIDYMLIIIWSGGYDSGVSRFLGDDRGNNWFTIRNRESNDHGFQFFVHDNEHSMGAGGTDAIDRTGPFENGNHDNFNHQNPQFLHQDLMNHPEYQLAFADAIQKHFFNDGVMTNEANVERFENRVAEVDPAIIAELARWGDSKRNSPFRKTNWENELNTIRNNYFPTRTNRVLNQLRGDDLWFTNVVAPSFSLHGGTQLPGTQIDLTSPSSGTIYYTLDGSDPRLPGGGINPTALTDLPITLFEDVQVRTRLRTSNGDWSPLNSATFNMIAAPADTSNLRVTEINYNPAPPTAAELAIVPQADNDDFEFFEITNTITFGVDVTGVSFSSGMTFTFPQASLPAGESAVIVADRDAFEARYGTNVRILGEYGPLSALNNGGESIGLVSANGDVIQNFVYGDEDDWPTLADGGGQSLVAIDLEGNYSSPLNWLPSGNAGTPGTHVVPAQSSSALRITEFHYNPGSNGGVEFVEFANTGNSNVDLNDYSFVEGIRFEFSESSITELAPGELAIITSNVSDFNAYYGAGLPVAGQFVSGSLSNGGERLILLDDQNQPVHDFVYDDADPWPTNADGNGQSLEVVDIDGNYSAASNWNGSATFGGTPGDGGGNETPGDFNGDGNLDCSDINQLSAESANGANNASFDVTGDGLVNQADVTFWVTSLFGTVMGDANLDGSTDISDFNIWNSSKFTPQSDWCSGNFNGDGSVDISDFNIWNSNKFTSAVPPVPTAPLGRSNVEAERIDSLFEVEDESDTVVEFEPELGSGYRADGTDATRKLTRRAPRFAEPIQLVFEELDDENDWL